LAGSDGIGHSITLVNQLNFCFNFKKHLASINLY